ncbi:TrmH family RNA methyltransferase [Salinarimonas soli]|uniref:RNA methyltransferase n=1 Tax=Salinarimonas soli TaxID=1638099 RepID=A0A5B2V2P9_9HYPH|nr:RNA methyltransferase [Salinarimonas soli]KAA2232469.1 RNA methyltransferase [Salinarimonas soli]
MPVVAIDDPDDPRLAPYRAVRERDLVGRQGLFMAEGEVVLRLLVRRGRFPLQSLLVSERRLEALGDLVADLPADCPVYAVSQAVMDGVAGFSIHRGVLGVGVRGEEPSLDALLEGLPPRALVAGLVGIANHDNVGGIFRNAAAFGADAVLVDPATCDPLYRKAIRVSVGAALVTPFARAASPDALLEGLARHGFTILALSPGGRRSLSEVRRTARMGVLLGTEGPGLPDAILGRVETVRIPMTGDFDSLNVATTSGIVLHHLAMQA